MLFLWYTVVPSRVILISFNLMKGKCELRNNYFHGIESWFVSLLLLLLLLVVRSCRIRFPVFWYIVHLNYVLVLYTLETKQVTLEWSHEYVYHAFRNILYSVSWTSLKALTRNVDFLYTFFLIFHFLIISNA